MTLGLASRERGAAPIGGAAGVAPALALHQPAWTPGSGRRWGVTDPLARSLKPYGLSRPPTAANGRGVFVFYGGKS